MQSRLILSNWILLIFYTVVLVLGIVAVSFLLAFYWEVDSIARIDPAAVDYRAYNSVELAPLSNQVVLAARRDFGNAVDIGHPNPFEDLEQDIEFPTSTIVLSATNTSQPIANPTATQIPSQTAIPSKTPAPTSSATFTLTPSATNTLGPTQEIIEPTQTNKPTKEPTTSVPKPTATPEPRPTQPPPTATSKPQPTKTPKPYPPPRPYP
jgi:hypothetical protein